MNNDSHASWCLSICCAVERRTYEKHATCEPNVCDCTRYVKDREECRLKADNMMVFRYAVCLQATFQSCWLLTALLTCSTSLLSSSSSAKSLESHCWRRFISAACLDTSDSAVDAKDSNNAIGDSGNFSARMFSHSTLFSISTALWISRASSYAQNYMTLCYFVLQCNVARSIQLSGAWLTCQLSVIVSGSSPSAIFCSVSQHFLTCSISPTLGRKSDSTGGPPTLAQRCW